MYILVLLTGKLNSTKLKNSCTDFNFFTYLTKEALGQVLDHCKTKESWHVAGKKLGWGKASWERILGSILKLNNVIW